MVQYALNWAELVCRVRLYASKGNREAWDMYVDHFGLSGPPFAAVPQVDLYFPGTAIETARQTLCRCVQRGEGAGMVVGPPGTGKTLLCQMLAVELRDTCRVVLLSNGRLSSRRALMQAILYELGQAYRGLEEGESRLALVDYLTKGEDCPRGILLLVDEAHSMPLRLLEEVRMLTDLARDGQPLVRLVLAGGSVLEERLASPKLDSFSQRLTARCYIESFNRAETAEYIHARLGAVGDNGDQIFPDETCRSVYQATDGVPRLINQVCDHALLLAYVAGRQQIESSGVEEAWADLQQLPTPWSEQDSAENVENNVIEFGGLDDSSDDDSASDAVDQAAEEDPMDEEPSGPALRISPIPDMPDEQLERIEQLLSDAEGEFRPAGSIGPEVELRFDEPAQSSPAQSFEEHFEQEEVVADRCAVQGTPEAAEGPPEPGDRQPEADGQRQGVRTVSLSRGESLSAAEPPDERMIVVEDHCDDTAPASRPIVAVPRQSYGRLFAKLRRG